MSKHRIAPALVLLGLGLFWSGCDTRTGTPFLNEPPNTRISAGPPEASDTSFNVNLFWFGWDDDGFVDYYEIAWESPEEGNWIGPIFANDSLFAVSASESCCVDPLPEYGNPEEGTFEEFHTFYVRSVDDRGQRDETPAYRSFNAKTIAPSTTISEGPRHTGTWGTRVRFGWTGEDDDGFVQSYKYALLHTDDYFADNPAETSVEVLKVIAWLDTLTYYPLGVTGGQHFYDTDSTVWRPTVADTVQFESVPSTIGNESIIFGVRAIDNAGAEEQVLSATQNVRLFNVSRSLDGPPITIISNIAGTFNSVDPVATREVFAGQGLHFRWRATPSATSDSPVAGYSYAADDTSNWTPFSENSLEFPPQVEGEEEIFWFPDVGLHTFFVRAIDFAGFTQALAARIRVFSGPRFAPEGANFVLVVLDTPEDDDIEREIGFPRYYGEQIEETYVRYWFEGYNVQTVYHTNGNVEPQLAVMDYASSTFWFHSSDTSTGDSVLLDYHEIGPNPLPSYVASGGNLFLCGVNVLEAARYFEKTDGDRDYVLNSPISFQLTLNDTTYVPHWMATAFGIAQIERPVYNTVSSPQDRIRVAHSLITGGSNPYPDLEFDPLSIADGPTLRGFGYYDDGMVVLDTGDPLRNAEPIYTRDDTGSAIGIRRLSPDGPGINGNVVYLGLHPYFVYRPQFRDLIRAVMADFGEFPQPGSRTEALGGAAR
ncbi:MAG: hypothetical protein R3B81_04455 [bacterium]